VARVASAVGAARAVAAAHGLRTEPRVLQDGLTPFGREVSLAGALASAGAPMVPPSNLLPPGPHRHGDTVLSFWTYVTVLPERPGPGSDRPRRWPAEVRRGGRPGRG
jgi:hypothetical protein